MDDEAMQPGPAEVALEGVFDLSAARSILRTIDEAPFDRDLRIDLTRVREFHDFAVAVLAEAVVSRRERVVVAGLGVHHVRLLHYLGLDRIVERRGESAEAQG